MRTTVAVMLGAFGLVAAMVATYVLARDAGGAPDPRTIQAATVIMVPPEDGEAVAHIELEVPRGVTLVPLTIDCQPPSGTGEC